MFQLDGKPLSPDVAFITADGTQYPANWLRLASPEERSAIGITEVPDPEQYDQRFYWGPSNPKILNDRPESKEDGSPLMVQVYDPETEQMVDTDEQVITKGLKSQWTSQIKATAGSLLAASDWKVVRASELPGKPVDSATLSYRAAVRAYSDSLETSIAACATVEDLIAVVTNQQWPEA